MPTRRVACSSAVTFATATRISPNINGKDAAMTTDLYAKCPCGSGKKIKFCCKDIIADIERIERMIQGEQRTAALDKINKLLEQGSCSGRVSPV